MNRFQKAITESRRQVRATMPVVPLRDDSTPTTRIRTSRQSFAFAAMNFEWMAEAAPEEITQEDIDAFSKAASRVTLVCAQLNMRKSIVHLTDVMGRAP